MNTEEAHKCLETRYHNAPCCQGKTGYFHVLQRPNLGQHKEQEVGSILNKYIGGSQVKLLSRFKIQYYPLIQLPLW